MSDQIVAGMVFASGVAVVSYGLRFLTPGGAVLQFVLGSIVFGFGGWLFVIPILAFFVPSSILSKVNKSVRPDLQSVFEKDECRDAAQVTANGGIPALIVLFWYYTQKDVLYIAYLGSVASATADTWGTGVGTLSKSSPRILTDFSRVETGRSGAVSPLGLFAALTGQRLSH